MILDAGTTTRQIGHHLVTRTRLTVITNNLPIAQDLATCPQINTILLGGVLNHRELCTIGGMLRKELAHFQADKFFLSAAGFSIKEGITGPDLAESEVKQAMIEAVREVILVVDSNKFQTSALVRVAPLRVAQAVFTDDFLPADVIREIEELGIKVYTPECLAAGIVRGDPPP